MADRLSVTLPGGLVGLGLGALPCEPPRDHRPDVAVGVIAVDGSTHFIPAGGAPIGLLDDGPRTAWPRSVAVTPDGRDAWVTECCEPVWGQWWHVDVGPRDPVSRPGYAVDLDSSATMLTSLGYSGVAIRDLDGAVLASENDLNALPVPRDPYDTAWIGRDRVAFLEFAKPDTRNEFRLVVTDARLTGYRDASGPVIATDLEAPWPRLAGADASGRIMVFQVDDHEEPSDIVRAYDSVTLERVPTATSTYRAGPHRSGSMATT
jgi:hypothetical protein